MVLRRSSRLRRGFRLAGILAGLFVCLGVVSAQAHEPPRPIVVELYTSQGCASCPPADAFLAQQLVGREGVLALSLPVTYWDMLGWKDTLASKANTDRQKAYAAAMGRGGIYTPQMIIDGINDVVGSREATVDKDIVAREADMTAVPVTLTLSKGEVHVSVGAVHHPFEGTGAHSATIWLFVVRPEAQVAITGGENQGHTVTYRNVVQTVKAVGIWKGKRVTLDLPRAALGGSPQDGVAAIVQRGGYGRIIGATPIALAATAKR